MYFEDGIFRSCLESTKIAWKFKMQMNPHNTNYLHLRWFIKNENMPNLASKIPFRYLKCWLGCENARDDYEVPFYRSISIHCEPILQSLFCYNRLFCVCLVPFWFNSIPFYSFWRRMMLKNFNSFITSGQLLFREARDVRAEFVTRSCFSKRTKRSAFAWWSSIFRSFDRTANVERLRDWFIWKCGIFRTLSWYECDWNATLELSWKIELRFSCIGRASSMDYPKKPCKATPLGFRTWKMTWNSLSASFILSRSTKCCQRRSQGAHKSLQVHV